MKTISNKLRRVAKAVGATPLVRLAAPTKEELGYADKCYVDEISALKCIIIVRDSEENKLSTLVLRGSTMSMLDSIERTVEDGVNTYRNALMKDVRNILILGIFYFIIKVCFIKLM